MVRKLMAMAAVACFLCVSVALAEEIKGGKVTKVDESASKITLTVDGKETEYTVTKDTKYPEMGKEKKAGTLALLAKAVEKSKDKGGVPFTVVTEKKDGKDVVVEFKSAGMKKKDK